jgi:hypothetical protein
MTDLRDHMHDTVDHQHADLAALTSRARTRGTTLRRRRRIAVTGSAVAVVAVLGAGVWAASGLLPGASVAPQDVPVADHGVQPKPAHRAPTTTTATGRSTVAALYAAVTDVVPGTGSKFAGQSPSEFSVDTYGELAFAPADGSGAGEIGVNVQDKSILTDGGVTADEGFVCLAWMEACHVSTLADGSLLRTYAEHSAAAGGGTGERLVAERLVGRVRVVASASNGFQLPADEWDITRPGAVLSIQQLTTVVSQPWWGFELPAEFSGARDVPSYTEYPSTP